MANTSLDIRQSQTRALQDQLNLNATQQMDSTLASINNELTPPGRLIAASTPSLVITVGSGTIVNPNTSKNRVLPFINNVPVSFTGGTITFPSTSGTITVSAGTNGSITIGASQYVAVLIQINSSGQFSLITGAAAGSLGAVVVPSGSTSLLSLGYVIVQSNASSVIQNITDAMLYQFVGGGGSGGGSGSGTGDDLDALQYQSDVTELFANSPTAAASTSTVDTTQTNATYSAANGYMTLSYDASKTVTGTGTAMTISATPSYTVAVGDILRVGTQARKITVVTTQTSYTIETAFSTNPSTAACTISQAVYSKDLNNFAFNGDAISAIYTGTISDCLVIYNDTATGTNYNYTDPALIAYTASADGSTYTTVQVREANPSVSAPVTSLATTGSDMFLRFFSNASTGTGTVNLVGYKAFFHRLSQTEAGGISAQALCFTNGIGTPVGCSNPTLVGGLTTIVLTNSYPVGVNSGFANGSIRVYLNGQKIPRFINSTLTPDASYTETNANTIQLDRNYSSLNYSVEVYQDIAVVDSNTQNTTNISNVQSAFGAGFQGFTDTTSFITTATTTTGSPTAGTFYSSIIGRASMPDLSQDVKPRFGIERIPTQVIQTVQSEVGPNGEPIWSTPNDLFGQIRFGGTWFIGLGNYGQRPVTTTASDFVEITFYGTALNFLTNSSINGAYTIYLDGVSQGSFTPTATSSVIAPRSVATNQVQNIVANLALGIHTVKLQLNGATELDVYGFEIINSNATPANVSVNSGNSYTQAQKLSSIAQNLTAYSSAVTGTTGGRMVVYQSSTGSIGYAFTANATSASYFSSASHTNEEIARVYNFREFGASRTDDFTNNNNPSTRCFTLDDGTTTLIGSANTYCGQVNSGQPEGMFSNANGEIIAFTFVGTGLDIYNPAAATVACTYNVTMDNTTIGTGLTGASLPSGKTIKVASGLPYGTHVVRFTCATGGGSVAALQFSRFTVYQPKTPAIPSGAVQVGSYNVMANYVFNSSSNTVQAGCSAGTLRKLGTREFNYTGTWTLSSTDYSMIGGFNTNTSTNGSFLTYTFFGTGFEYRGDLPGGTLNTVLSVDGQANFTTSNSSPVGGVGWTGALTTNFLQGSGATGATFTASTGTIGGTSSGGAYGSVTSVSGMTLGIHTVKILNNGSANLYADGIDIITPVHSYKSNLYADEQDTLSVGSNAISDDRKFTPVANLPSVKAWSQAFGVISGATTTSTTPVPCPDLSTTVKTSGGALRISYSVDSYNSTAGNAVTTQIYVDGVAVGQGKQETAPGAGYPLTVSDCIKVPVSAGTHKVDVYWSTTATATLNGTLRNMLVEET